MCKWFDGWRLTNFIRHVYATAKFEWTNKYFTWMAVSAATIAGDPKPCEIREKCVKCRCMDGSNICCGLVLHNGDRSWFSKSISSFVTCIWMTIYTNRRFDLVLFLRYSTPETRRWWEIGWRFYYLPVWCSTIFLCDDMFLGVRCVDVTDIQLLAVMETPFRIHNQNRVRDVLLRLSTAQYWMNMHWVLKIMLNGVGHLPSTSDVSSVTLAALRRPAGKLSPIFSSFSRNSRPPFLLFAL